VSVRIIFHRLLGGWYIVTGPYDVPISGRFATKKEAQLKLSKPKPR
jgi:hypothetical protein